MKSILKYFSLYLMFALISCEKNSNYLDRHFNKLKHKSPPRLVEEFRKLPMDSAVIQNEKFNKIFVEAASNILNDSIEKAAFEEYFKKNNIQLLGRQDKWTIVAAFHKYLNKEDYEIYELWQEMVNLSNIEFEKQYPKPKEKHH